MRYKLLSWVCAHRHKSDDLYLEEIKKDNIDLSSDFKLLRNSLYEYSGTNLDKMISDPAHAYFLHVAMT